MKKVKTAKIKTPQYYILQYDLDGCYVNKYSDISSAANNLGVSATSISKVLRGERKSAAGFIWRKQGVDEKIDVNIIVGFDTGKINSGKAKKIAQIDSNGHIMQEFESISEAARKTNTSTRHIQNELSRTASNQWKLL